MRPEPVDPFDLPEWLGEASVTWASEAGLSSGHLVTGRLTGDRSPGEASERHEVACDLLAIDEAYPVPVASEALRTSAHQAWRHGEILLASSDGRLTLLVPGRTFDADLVLDALGRLAKAVGAAPGNYAAHLQIGG